MRYLTEYRNADIARALAKGIRATATRQWTMMEVCGGQTHTIVRQGLDELTRRRRGDDPRSRLPGVRDAAGADRPRAATSRRGRG